MHARVLRVAKQRASFTPSPPQVRVFKRISRPEYSGKELANFLGGLINVPAVQFKPHPVVLVRLYDFQFGIRGLSVMHFVQFTVLDGIVWMNEGSANFGQFTANS